LTQVKREFGRVGTVRVTCATADLPGSGKGGSHILRGEVRAKEPGIGRKKAEETPGQT
jgi:hypothetical protein